MIGYFGAKGTHLEVDRNINQSAVLGAAGGMPFVALSASSQFLPGKSLSNRITERDSGSNSSYNALRVAANQRLGHGLQFNASYAFSHSIDEVSRNNASTIVQDSTDIFNSRGNSDFDARHRFVANAIPGGTLGFVVLPATLTPATLKSFTTITGTRFPTADSGSSRQLQLALKLQF